MSSVSVVVLHASHCLSPSLIQILIAIKWLSSAVPYLPLINRSNWQCFRIKALCQVPHRKHTKGNGQNSGGREALKPRGKGTRREALQGGDKIKWYD